MSTITGYQQDTQGAWIAKDIEARLIYSMDWSQWLTQGQTVLTVDYSHNSRSNDANPLVIHTEGVTNMGTLTFVEISGGTLNKTYTVTAEITTDDGSKDRRAFKILIQNRLAQ
jgi:hypothetical protein